MLNLSDNELDRLSREAASQHDPGDPLGPQSWERLELHLDKELGRAGPDMSRGLRGFRRLPFQYAPVLLLVVGVTYYFVKAKGRKTESSGSPPLTVVKTPQQTLPGTASDSSLKNPAYSDKSTSTLYPGGDSLSDAGLEHPRPNNTFPAAGDHTASGLANNSRTDHTATGPGHTAPGQDHLSSGLNDDVSGANRTASGLTNHGSRKYPGNNKTSGKGNRSSGNTGHQTVDQAAAGQAPGDQTTSDRTSLQDQALKDQPLRDHTGRLTQAPPDKSSDPERVFIQHPFSLRSHPRTSDLTLHADSALRAYAARNQKDQAQNSGPALRINRAFGIGLLFAPDFTSVNALAGDRPGSTFGLTLDYEILDKLHVGTGVLFSKRNYTARGMDYHVPYDYYRQNGMKPVDFVKGTMNMLEIPINIRYDFSVTGYTSFFASAGVSSYLFGKENCNYYYDFFGSEACRKFQYSNTPNGLFSSVNLSMGVETRISTSGVYVLIAPYMKLPTGDMGFGKVRMNSVGINFAIRYTPVISRKRHP